MTVCVWDGEPHLHRAPGSEDTSKTNGLGWRQQGWELVGEAEINT